MLFWTVECFSQKLTLCFLSYRISSEENMPNDMPSKRRHGTSFPNNMLDDYTALFLHFKSSNFMA